MSALVYWFDSKESSVIPISTIETPNNQPPEVGHVYQIKWLKKTYPGRILRLSDNSSDFDDTLVTEEGLVIDAVMRENDLRDQLNIEPTIDALNMGAYSNMRKRRREEGTRPLEMAPDLTNNKYMVDNPIFPGLTALAPTISERIPLPEPQCCKRACIEMLDRVINYASDLRRQLVEEGGDLFDVCNEISTNPTSSGAVERKVELVPGSGVYINRREKLSISKGYRDKPNEMVRQLVKAILGDSIKDMSARGTSGSRGIPREVIQAVQVFVADHSKEISNKAMTKILNNMISGMRHPHKKRKDADSSQNSNDHSSQSGTPLPTPDQNSSQSLDVKVDSGGSGRVGGPGEGIHFMTCDQ